MAPSRSFQAVAIVAVGLVASTAIVWRLASMHADVELTDTVSSESSTDPQEPASSDGHHDLVAEGVEEKGPNREWNLNEDMPWDGHHFPIDVSVNPALGSADFVQSGSLPKVGEKRKQTLARVLGSGELQLRIAHSWTGELVEIRVDRSEPDNLRARAMIWMQRADSPPSVVALNEVSGRIQLSTNMWKSGDSIAVSFSGAGYVTEGQRFYGFSTDRESLVLAVQ